MHKGSESDTLAAEINRILEEARQEGVLAQLSIQFLGADLTNPL